MSVTNATSLSITTFSVTTLSIMRLKATLSITILAIEWHDEYSFFVILNF
jgi:hypothetical protein